VVELATWYTAPSAACILADQGADVVKVEAPAGDVFRHSGTSRAGMSAQWVAGNRNKRFVMLDLKQEGELAKFRQLVAKADVFIHNVRPGGLARLGLDPEALRKEHPRLICAAVYGYGKDGPFADAPGFDTLFQALSGMCHIQKDHQTGKPQVVRSYYIDKATGLMVAQAISTALFQRERTGEGAFLEYAMTDGTVWFTWPDGMTHDTFIGDDVPLATVMGEVDMVAPTADGFLICLPHLHWEAFCRLTGRSDIADRPDFATPRLRMTNLKEFYGEVVRSFGGKTTAAWCELLQKEGVPVAPVLKPEDLKNHPQVVWNGSVEVVEDEVLGPYRAPLSPVRFDGQAFGTRNAPRAPGTDTEAVLRDWGI
jgi:crotonobetainyl-CoA:carnitine CoA-transferase CaiB-like acyl-CoA transferase